MNEQKPSTATAKPGPAPKSIEGADRAGRPLDGNQDGVLDAFQPDTITVRIEDLDALVDAKVAEKLQDLVDGMPDDEVAGEPTQYAVYDVTYKRFVGDVVDTEEAARKIARDKGVSVFVVREV